MACRDVAEGDFVVIVARRLRQVDLAHVAVLERSPRGDSIGDRVVHYLEPRPRHRDVFQLSLYPHMACSTTCLLPQIRRFTNTDIAGRVKRAAASSRSSRC